jgi:hypothetical protein
MMLPVATDEARRAPPPPDDLNPLSIAALVCSILGATPFAGPLMSTTGLVLSGLALRASRRRGGRRMAVAALTVSVAGLAFGLYFAYIIYKAFSTPFSFPD